MNSTEINHSWRCSNVHNMNDKNVFSKRHKSIMLRYRYLDPEIWGHK
jgi:hypothetical protein